MFCNCFTIFYSASPSKCAIAHLPKPIIKDSGLRTHDLPQYNVQYFQVLQNSIRHSHQNVPSNISLGLLLRILDFEPTTFHTLKCSIFKFCNYLSIFYSASPLKCVMAHLPKPIIKDSGPRTHDLPCYKVQYFQILQYSTRHPH